MVELCYSFFSLLSKTQPCTQTTFCVPSQKSSTFYTMGWIQPVLPLVKRAEGVSFNHKICYAGNNKTWMDKRPRGTVEIVRRGIKCD